ncbi:MAG: DUF362 domain-containing protein, partial [Anaerolineae bacterium]|nr:DUF362 domain-containing protein [Anaerolineae bacterium]
MAHQMTRRRFLSGMLVASGLALWGAACSSAPAMPLAATRRPVPAPAAGQAYLAVAHSEDAAAATRAALAALGGMGRFVKAGDDVIIKPNICTDYHPPEYATTTNPTVVATLVTLCREAGARRVRVMD